jgi:hypothetical protein
MKRRSFISALGAALSAPKQKPEVPKEKHREVIVSGSGEFGHYDPTGDFGGGAMMVVRLRDNSADMGRCSRP